MIQIEDIYGHKWWFEFDDDNNKLIFAKRIDALEKFVSVGSIFNLTEIFDDSLIIQVYWSGKIDMEKKEPYKIEKKISFLSLVKKYFSKKIRVQISNIKSIFN